MKKFLLFGLAAMMSTTMFAQTLDGEIEVMPIDIEDNTEVSTDDGIGVQVRTKDTGLYYAKPVGAMYRRYYSSTGGVYANTDMYYPFGEDVKFVNMSTDASATHWKYLNGSSVWSTRTADADYGLTLAGLDVGYMWYLPYLYNTDESEYYISAYYGMDESRSSTRHRLYGSGNPGELYWHGWADTKTSTTTTSNYDSYYVYGSGSRERSFTVYDKDGNKSTITTTFPRNSVKQDLPSPKIPMFVDGIYVNGASFGFDDTSNMNANFQPLRNDAVLTMNFYDLETDELLETLTATTGDWTYWGTSSSNYRSGTYMTGYLKFSKKDENGDEVPIIIDRATTMEIEGFYNDDIDLGFRYNPYQDPDLDYPNTVDDFAIAYNYFIDPSGEYTIPGGVGSTGACLSVSFNGVMDYVNVADALSWTDGSSVSGYRKLSITADGKTNYTTDEGIDGDHNFGGLYIQTALPWDVSIGYSLADAPDWITGITGTAYGSSTNVYKVTVQAEENLYEERSAVVHMWCKAYADDVDITITQEAGAYTGITEVEANEAPAKTGAIYNLAGQKVNESAKGVVIVDGKKVIK